MINQRARFPYGKRAHLEFEYSLRRACHLKQPTIQPSESKIGRLTISHNKS
ncbi:hypothetical protein PAGL106935_27015 [Paenibacillus glucanolyticus]